MGSEVCGWAVVIEVNWVEFSPPQSRVHIKPQAASMIREIHAFPGEARLITIETAGVSGNDWATWLFFV